MPCRYRSVSRGVGSSPVSPVSPMRAFLLAVLFTTAAVAQPSDPVEALAAALSLDTDQADLVAEVYVSRDPASVWTLAAELVPTLDADQRAALFARPERPDGAGRQGGRQGRGGQGRGRRAPDEAQRAVVRAARDAALGLDAATSARLDAVVADPDRRETLRALREGTVPEAIAAVLTPEQAELYRAQLALGMHLRRAGRPGLTQ